MTQPIMTQTNKTMTQQPLPIATQTNSEFMTISDSTNKTYQTTTHNEYLSQHRNKLNGLTMNIVEELDVKIAGTMKEKPKEKKKKKKKGVPTEGGRKSSSLDSPPKQRLGSVTSQFATTTAIEEKVEMVLTDPETKIFFTKMKADQFANLALNVAKSPQTDNGVEVDGDTATLKALDSYEEAIELANAHLEPTDMLKIQTVIKCVICFYDLCGHTNDAFIIGKKALLRAEKYARLASERAKRASRSNTL